MVGGTDVDGFVFNGSMEVDGTLSEGDITFLGGSGLEPELGGAKNCCLRGE